MPAVDAHHMRARVVSDLGTRIGQRLIGGWLEAEMERPVQARAHYGDYLQVLTAGYMADNIKVAESFYINDDMLTLAEHASHNMPNEWLRHDEVPAEAGFLWLPRALYSHDVRGRLMNTRAISWHTFRTRLAVTFWTDRDDPLDEINKQIRADHYDAGTSPYGGWENFPKLQLQHVMPVKWGGSMPHFPDTSNLRRWREMLGVEWLVNYEEDGLTWAPNPEVGTEENRVHARRLLVMNPPTESTDPITNFFAAFCRLCAQSITVSEKEPVPRVARRRYPKLPNNDEVTVITLRHAAVAREHGESQVEWSHRWLRRGHWRRQWYGSGDDRHQVPIYINEAICGPEDKPLVIREHVTSLSR